MAGITTIEIKIIGISGHGSCPEKCNNPLPAAARVYLKILDYVTNYQKNLSQNIRFSLTRLDGGTTFNVIPESCILAGSLRTFKEEDSETITKKIREIIRDICEENNLEFFFEAVFSPAVINTKKCAEFVRKVAKEQYGDNEVGEEGSPVYGSEDFSYFLKEIPGAFFFRIIKNLRDEVNIHHNEYDFDDSVIEDMSFLWWNIVKERLCNVE